MSDEIKFIYSKSISKINELGKEIKWQSDFPTFLNEARDETKELGTHFLRSSGLDTLPGPIFLRYEGVRIEVEEDKVFCTATVVYGFPVNTPTAS